MQDERPTNGSSSVEQGIKVDEDFAIPEGRNEKDFIEGFVMGCAYHGGAMRKRKIVAESK